jgi:hypothetical protein
MMLSRWTVFSCAVLLCGVIPGTNAQSPPPAPACKPAGSLARLAGLPEASGLAVSRAVPGRLWTHNDSGAPVLVALDAGGKSMGQVSLSGAKVEDWEALTIGACPAGACLYVGDIGDNDAKRAHITVYRIPEPKEANGAVTVKDVFQATYPDGSHDAESLLVAPDGTLLVVTKGDTGPVAVYRFPKELRAGTPMRLERVGQPLAARAAADARITDAAISSDGRSVVLRTKTTLTFYRAAEFLRGQFQETGRTDLTALGEPQGEAVAFGSGGTIYVAGEGGGKKQPGTLATLSCGT